MRHRFALVAITALAACATGSAVTPPIMSLSSLNEVTADSLLGLNALCSADAISERTVAPDLKLAAGMGTGGFKVDTDTAEAQQWFNYGLALSHAFYHQDVKAAMKRSVELDPACSMCSWGEAWALGPTLNYGIKDDERKLALAAAERAKSLAKPGDALASRLADAMVARYAEPAPKAETAETKAASKTGEGAADSEKEDTEPDFAKALAAIAADYPQHPELTVLAAHSLMMASSEEKREPLKEALVLLEKVLKEHPDDTGAIHYYIHATEFDERAEDALPYARRLGALAPNASHLVHMPAHTFFRAGLYQEAAVVNAQAIAADVSWMGEGGDARPPMFNDFRLPMYYSHNLAFGLAGAMMSGDGELALRYADHARKAYPDAGEKQRFDPTPRTYVALARYAPDRMLALTLAPGERDKAEFGVYHAYGRGEALLQKGDAAGARVEIRTLRKLAGDEAEYKIALAVLEGRLAMAEGNTRAAVGRFAAGAKLQEDAFGTWMDPPTWWFPLRRSLAAAHLKGGDFARAEEEAGVSLKAWKHDPLALWVLGKAQLGRGAVTEGEATLARAKALWRGDFNTITVEAI